MELIRCEELSKIYQSGGAPVHAVDGVSLSFEQGSFTAVTGKSGSGKSTLLHLLSGRDRPTSGRVVYQGKNLFQYNDNELSVMRRRRFGFVFQAYNLVRELSAQENIQFIAEIAKDPMPAEEALALVGLSERAGNFPSALSGGQQQRVSIARAIVKNPQIIFADEPTAALDYHTSIEVLHVFEEIVKTKGSTVVMITHNPEIARMADRVIKLRDGKVFSIRRNLNPARAEELVW